MHTYSSGIRGRVRGSSGIIEWVQQYGILQCLTHTVLQPRKNLTYDFLVLPPDTVLNSV